MDGFLSVHDPAAEYRARKIKRGHTEKSRKSDAAKSRRAA